MAESKVISREDLMAKYPNPNNGKAVTANTFRQTMYACGVNPGRKEFSLEEEQRFAIARKMIEQENKTYRQVAEHFKIDLKDASDEEIGGAFSENQAAEATGSTGDVAFDMANSLSRNQADRVASLMPALTAYHLNRLMNDGTVQQKFAALNAKLCEASRGNAEAILMQGIERLEAEYSGNRGLLNGSKAGKTAEPKSLAPTSSATSSNSSKSSAKS